MFTEEDAAMVIFKGKLILNSPLDINDIKKMDVLFKHGVFFAIEEERSYNSSHYYFFTEYPIILYTTHNKVETEIPLISKGDSYGGFVSFHYHYTDNLSVKATLKKKEEMLLLDNMVKRYGVDGLNLTYGLINGHR